MCAALDKLRAARGTALRALYGRFVRASLASAEKQLAQYHFSRCNQCYLVNLQYVKAVENDFVHVNTDRLEISRRQRAAFLTAVASYIGGVL